MPDNANDPNVNPPTNDPPVNTPDPNEPPVDDLSILFTPEEVTAKKEAVATAKAEEERRAKLTDAERQAEDKAKADLDAVNVVPEKYADFKVPQGMEVDKAMLEEAAPLFKMLGLSQDKAQKIVDFYSTKIIPGFIKTQTETWNAQKESWVNAVKDDKEIGGDKFKTSVESAQRVLNTLGTPELKKVFDEFGLGNHPEFVRVFAKMSEHLKEDTIINNNDKGKPPANTIEGMATFLYDNTATQ